MTNDHGPLSGYRVIEAGTLIAGPFCGQLLGDFGAEVIKIEDPTHGDPMRGWGAEVGGDHLQWQILGRNKKSVTCNLRTAEGQDLMRQLVGSADVLLENFRPGTLERWGLGYEELAKDNPGLVLTRITGYGQTGPYAGRAGFGSVGEAMGGVRYITGDPDRRPSRAGVSLGDSLAGMFSAYGTVLALLGRERTGRGQVVDTAIYEAVLALMESLVPEWQLAGQRRERTGSILPGVAPSNTYPTADDSQILIGANRDTVFTRLCTAMDRPELAKDARYASHAARGVNQHELDDLISTWTRSLSAADALERLHADGVPAGLIYTAEDMLQDPHFAAREAITTLMHRSLGEVPMQNVTPRLSSTPGELQWIAPDLGQHNDEVYGGVLGLNESERTRLAREGVI
ncbi:CaiB/BaiF CoA transferase family protein [Demetria terragena]|uniref:CaiB/BaiF CoA transferase family protein n=1 Tax=Demetria terragena TaxID=63959 RepID=UPI000374980F|nr:CaiB/BaiF CoA-transferase family protein [Demetria terragena]